MGLLLPAAPLASGLGAWGISSRPRPLTSEAGWLLSAALSAPVVPLGSYKKVVIGTSLVVQWLRLGTASTAGDEGSIPGGGAKIQHAGQVVGLLQCW